MPTLPLKLTPDKLLGGARPDSAPAPIPGATWYRAEAIGDGMSYRFPMGTLANAGYLTADVLLDGNHLAVFRIVLQEGEGGPTFSLSYGLLNQCQARIRMPFEAVNQNNWMGPREGAWLKPSCQNLRVDLAKVERMRIEILRKSSLPVRWCMTPVTITNDEPPLLDDPLMPKGALLDELGQSTLHEWPTKSRSQAEVTERLKAQLAAAPSHRLPEGLSRWGGWLEKRVEGTGFFRAAQVDGRWWLVDPDGYVFWSSGPDCVRVDTDANFTHIPKALTWLPEAKGEYKDARHERAASWEPAAHSVNYLAANFIRAFGPEKWYENWGKVALAELRRVGFNTVANWSEWKVASQAKVPYVRPMGYEYKDNMPRIYRDFPDVFDPKFEKVCKIYADFLKETVNDPAFIGYFLMNEPSWGFSEESPAAGMLFTTAKCHSRTALAEFLRERYGTVEKLAAAWGMDVSFEAIIEGRWKQRLTPAAQADLADFSSVMVDKFFGDLSAACRRVDPNHLNLGIRYYTIPPAWALKGMRHFDVFSMNCYQPQVFAKEMEQISSTLNMPILIGEWHFGAQDAGQPAAGIGHVPTQEDRGTAYRFYLEDAAAKPWCVGVHYFTLYDESALGRFDGENYNIGFLDVCNHPYESLAAAARLSHERMYQVAAGQVAPVTERPEYLPLLYM